MESLVKKRLDLWANNSSKYNFPKIFVVITNVNKSEGFSASYYFNSVNEFSVKQEIFCFCKDGNNLTYCLIHFRPVVVYQITFYPKLIF